MTNITGAFQSALTGIGQSSSVMYSQIFLCESPLTHWLMAGLGVFYFIWAFLFANFNKKLDIDAGRTFIWEVLHFFLHFTLLILIAAMVVSHSQRKPDHRMRSQSLPGVRPLSTLTTCFTRP